jgi:hypothetical protein
MTAVSQREHGELRNFTGLSRLAWTSLVGVGAMALGSIGCLVTEKPEFKPPSQTPPFLSHLNPSPNDILLIPRRPGTSESMNSYVDGPTLTFDVYSEDLGELLFGVVFLGPPATRTYLRFFPPSAGTVDVRRPHTYTIKVPDSIGRDCHSITALFSHDPEIYNSPQSDQPVGTATWWAQIGFDSTVPDPEYKPCEPNPRPGDAGADAAEAGGL